MTERTWSPREDSLIRVASPEVAAARLGIDVVIAITRREELGLPPFQSLVRPRVRRAPKPKRVRTNLWTPEQDEAVCLLSRQEAAAKTGRTLAAVIARRSVLSARGVPIPDQRTIAERTKAGRSIWTAEADALVRANQPIVAARLLGVSRSAIGSRRKALGLPNFPRPRKAVNDRPKRKCRRWTLEEDRLLLLHTPHEVSQQTGRTIQAINYRRITLRASGIQVKQLQRGVRSHLKNP